MSALGKSQEVYVEMYPQTLWQERARLASSVHLHSSLGGWIPDDTMTASFVLQKDPVGTSLSSLYSVS